MSINTVPDGEKTGRKINRRDVLKSGIVSGVSLLLMGCESEEEKEAEIQKKIEHFEKGGDLILDTSTPAIGTTYVIFDELSPETRVNNRQHYIFSITDENGGTSYEVRLRKGNTLIGNIDGFYI